MSEQPQDKVLWCQKDQCAVGRLWMENRSRYPMDQLDKYLGQYVAWIPDGSGIHDSDRDPVALEERIRASGDDPLMYPIEFITDETYF
jgi:hypothetical protein